MKNSLLVMVGILGAVAMLSAAVVVLPMQQASAQDTDFNFEQDQSNECSGSSECSNEGTIIFLPGHGSPGGG
jgi:hypothetical protein